LCFQVCFEQWDLWRQFSPHIRMKATSSRKSLRRALSEAWFS